MQLAYWIVAGLLALLYLYSGGMKVLRSKAQLAPMMKWVDVTPMAAVRTIGALELLAAVGLILPPLTKIAPGLAIAAAVGLVLVQIGATVLHVRRGESRQIGFNLVLLLLAVVAAWLGTVWV